LQVILRQNDLTPYVIRSAIQAHDPAILWFLTHTIKNQNGESAIHLGSGRSLGISELISYIKSNTSVTLLVLNACETVDIAQAINEETGIGVICTIHPVLDYIASVTGAMFAEQLAKHGNVARAYRESKPGGNRTYLYLPRVASMDYDLVTRVNDHERRIIVVETRLEIFFQRHLSGFGRMAPVVWIGAILALVIFLLSTFATLGILP